MDIKILKWGNGEGVTIYFPQSVMKGNEAYLRNEDVRTLKNKLRNPESEPKKEIQFV